MTAPGSAICPRCGGDNRCGFGAPQPCWCATDIAHRLAPQPAATACYCRTCLEELIAQRERATHDGGD